MNSRERARRLVMQHGWNSVCYQILNPGFDLWFSTAGDAVVGYVSQCGVWVVGGAPVCEESRLGAVVEEFEAAAQSSGCKVCYFGAGLRLYEGCSHPPAYSVAALGAQPAWNPTEWAAIIARRSSLRAQLNRAWNKGVEVHAWTEANDQQFGKADLEHCLAGWIARRRMPTMKFLVEPDTLDYLEDRRIWIAMRGSALVGYLVASPVPRRNGWLIEQIIRSGSAPNGTNELLLNEAISWFAREGATYVTLGLVPLSTQADEYLAGNPYWLRVMMLWARAHGKRFYNFNGLERFKSKFSPQWWEPIFAICNQRQFTPRMIYAIAAAFSYRNSPMLQGVGAIGRAARQEIVWLRKK